MLLPELKERVISTHSLLGNTSGKINSKHFKSTGYTHTHIHTHKSNLLTSLHICHYEAKETNEYFPVEH